jgi:anaerobic ribonucleoside-triphosphate reductase
MTLNKAQFQQLIDNYANHIIEGLDNDSMEIMLFDLITAEYADYTEEQIVGEIEELYGEEVATELIESASDVPVEEVSTI